MRRKLTITILAALLVVAVAQPAYADEEAELRLKTKKTAAIVEGDTVWVSLSWTAKEADARDFRVIATPRTRGVTVEYPENTGDHTSLMVDDVLLENEIDFTSIKVHVPYGTKSFRLPVVAYWTDDDGEHKEQFTVRVPVAKHKGDDIAMSSSELGSVSQGEPVWKAVAWTGIAPELADVKMTVAGPADLVVVYPGEGSSTSLHYDDVLDDGETDEARFLVDASALSPGSYDVAVTLSYAKAGRSHSVDGRLTLTVE